MPSVLGSRSHVGVKGPISVQPAGHAAVPSVPGSRSHVGVNAGESSQPAGHAAELSVPGSRSHVDVPSVAVPVQDAGTETAVPVHEGAISVAVPMHEAVTSVAVPVQEGHSDSNSAHVWPSEQQCRPAAHAGSQLVVCPQCQLPCMQQSECSISSPLLVSQSMYEQCMQRKISSSSGLGPASAGIVAAANALVSSSSQAHAVTCVGQLAWTAEMDGATASLQQGPGRSTPLRVCP